MKKRIIILGSVVVAVVVLWSVAWLFGANYIKQTIEAQAAADGVSQPRVTCETLNVGGFPFRYDVHCESAQMASCDLAL